jgi:hypothetical protein
MWKVEDIIFVIRPKETMSYVVVKDFEIPAPAVKAAEYESEGADGEEFGEAGQIVKKGELNSKYGLNGMRK